MDISHYIAIFSYILTILTAVVISIKVLKLYSQNKTLRLFFFAIGFFFGAIASIGSLGIRISLIFFQNGHTAVFFADIAIIFAMPAGISVGYFGFDAILPKKFTKLATGVLIIGNTSMAIYTQYNLPTANLLIYEVVWPIHYCVIVLFIVTITVLTFIFLFFYYSLTMRRQSPPHARRAAWIGIGFCFWFVYGVIELMYIGPFKNYYRLLLPIFTLILYLTITRFWELEWPNKIRHVFIINSHNGIGIYDHSFVEEDVEEDMDKSQLIASGLSGITGLLQEITKSQQRTCFVDQGDIKIILEYGTYVIMALLTTETFSILRKKLKTLLQAFEARYHKDLENFNGSLEEFKSSKSLIEEIFSFKDLFDKK